jgi:anti-anti-sigma regulatory factor
MQLAMKQDVAVIAFMDDFDISGEERAEALLARALADHVSEVRLDFSQAAFVGVSGVRFALMAQERVRTYGGRVRVVASHTARRVFDVTRAPVEFAEA